jgi:tetratricopeptide (TPR) repeat protein
MVTLMPRSAVLHSDLGAALSLLGRSEDAIRHYREAARLHPYDPLVRYNLGVELAKSPETVAQAVDEYEQSLMVDPRQLKAHLNLSQVLLSQAEINEALMHCERAVKLKPDHVVAQYNLGKVLLLSEKPKEGIEHLREVLRISPSSVPAMKDMAWFLATHPSDEVRDPNEAVKVGERALMMTAGREAGVLDALAAAYASNHEFRKAAETAERALAIAKRLRDHESAGQIENRLRLYEFECAYYENPRVQLERLVVKAKQAEGRRPEAGGVRPENRGDSNPQSAIRNPQLKDARMEVQDEAEAIVAE